MLKNKTDCRGFTMIELIITMAVIIILASIAVPSYLNIKDKAKISTDNASIVILNNATVAYAMTERLEAADIFEGISSDTARMEKLVDEKYLSTVVSPQQKDAQFNWLVENQRWVINGEQNDDSAPDNESGEEPQPTATPGGEVDLSDYPLWSAETIYDVADTYVVYDGKLYYNLWWVDGTISPGASQVWQQVTDEWVFFNIYNTGDTVEYNGQTYRARFWTTGTTPAHSEYDDWELIG